jgi:hypothetical protein
MRRLIQLACVIGMVVVCQVPTSVDAGQPVRFPTQPFAGTIPAGLLCPTDFDIDIAVVGARVQTETDFKDQAGHVVRMMFTGPESFSLTNVTTGKQIVVDASGPGNTYLHADGSSFNAGGGHALVGLFPSDEGGPALFTIVGHETFTRDADGTIHDLVIEGTVTDLCKVLAT